MQAEEAKVSEILGRLERLERDNRRLKRAALAAVVLVAAAVGLGAAYATPAIPQKIVAHEFEVVDASGKVRIRLGVQKSGFAAVNLMDGEGVAQVSMSVPRQLGGYFGPSIVLGLHEIHGAIAGLPASARSPDVTIGDTSLGGPRITLEPSGHVNPSVDLDVIPPFGLPGIGLIDSKGVVRASMSLSASGAPTIELSGPQGYRMDLGSTRTVIPATGQTQHTSAASIVMFGNDKKHHVIWQAPN